MVEIVLKVLAKSMDRWRWKILQAKISLFLTSKGHPHLRGVLANKLITLLADQKVTYFGWLVFHKRFRGCKILQNLNC